MKNNKVEGMMGREEKEKTSGRRRSSGDSSKSPEDDKIKKLSTQEKEEDRLAKEIAIKEKMLQDVRNKAAVIEREREQLKLLEAKRAAAARAKRELDELEARIAKEKEEEKLLVEEGGVLPPSSTNPSSLTSAPVNHVEDYNALPPSSPASAPASTSDNNNEEYVQGEDKFDTHTHKIREQQRIQTEREAQLLLHEAQCLQMEAEAMKKRQNPPANEVRLRRGDLPVIEQQQGLGDSENISKALPGSSKESSIFDGPNNEPPATVPIGGEGVQTNKPAPTADEVPNEAKNAGGEENTEQKTMEGAKRDRRDNHENIKRMVRTQQMADDNTVTDGIPSSESPVVEEVVEVSTDEKMEIETIEQPTTEKHIEGDKGDEDIPEPSSEQQPLPQAENDAMAAEKSEAPFDWSKDSTTALGEEMETITFTRRRPKTVHKPSTNHSSPLFDASATSKERWTSNDNVPYTPSTNHTSQILDSSDDNYLSPEPSSSLTSSIIRQKGSSALKRRVRPSSPISSLETESVDVDVESQSKKSISSSNRSSGDTMPSTTTNVSPRILFRKIMVALLTDLDDGALRREDTETILIVITLLKEVMLGIIIAFFLGSLFLFIDHRFLLGLPTARNFRKATFAVMNSKETLINFEENAGLKFLDMEKYESMVQEIEQSANKTIIAESILKARDEDLAEIAEEMAQYDGVLPKLFKSLGLHMFCETCTWHMRLNCINRAIHVEKAYGSPKFEAMLSAMEDGKCRKSDAQVVEERKKKVLEDEMLKDWKGKNEKDFCFQCEYDAGTSCNQRAAFLNNRFAMTFNEAKAKLMVESPKCTNTFRAEEDKKLMRFNEDAEWGNKMSCRKRVDYLMYTYKNSERVAMLATMERPQCMLPEKEASTKLELMEDSLNVF